ncbi:MAG: DUF131 domain-containing protein [Methanosarcinaceae archaeon]|nr:DUF131 domain-containing protein [Methanosarcinaceae archaeon]
MMSTLLISVGLLLLILGSLLVISGSIASIFRNRADRDVPDTPVKGGGIIMVGPIPIVFGSDNKSVQTLLILAIVLMVLYFVVFR